LQFFQNPVEPSVYKDWWWLLSPGQDTEIAPKNLRLSKLTHMTIHWKALEQHFLMVPLVFWFTHFWGKNIFFEFFPKKILSLKEGSCHTWSHCTKLKINIFVISMEAAIALSCDVTCDLRAIVVDYTIILRHCDQCLGPFMLIAWIFIEHIWHHNSDQWLPPRIW
jgi:hypothetical protein